MRKTSKAYIHSLHDSMHILLAAPRRHRSTRWDSSNKEDGRIVQEIMRHASAHTSRAFRIGGGNGDHCLQTA
jgi:hypothetical protein